MVNASDLMRSGAAPHLGDDLHAALGAMIAHGVARLPVLDAEEHVVGFVDEAAVARAYLHGRAPRRGAG